MKNKNFIYLGISAFSYYLIVGLILSVFSMLLRSHGANLFQIGISDSIRRFFGLITLFCVPFLVNRFGFHRMSMVSILMYTISMLAMPFYTTFSLWLFLIAIFGCGVKIFASLINTALNVIATNDKRGIYNSIFSIISIVAIASAPTLISFTKSNNYETIFIFCGLLNIVNLFTFSQIEESYKEIKFIKNLKLLKYYIENTNLFNAKVIFEFTSSSLFIFTPVYAHDNGWSYEKAGLLLTIYSITGLLSSWATGYAFDKVKNKNLLLNSGTIATLFFLSLLSIFIENQLATFIIYGGLGITTGFIYLGCLCVLNSKYKKEELVSVNSSLTIFGGVSVMCYGIICGWFMEKYKSIALPVLILGTIYLFFLLKGILWRKMSSVKE